MEGDEALRGNNADHLDVSNPLRVEGDQPDQCFLVQRQQVSNPLRLEGDVRPPQLLYRVPQFLIHYGWRGTEGGSGEGSSGEGFLIHYGWRGTRRRVAVVERLVGF